MMSKPAWVGGGQTAALPGAQCWWLCSAPGLTSEGIYRKSGQNSKTTSLLEVLRRDARSVRLKEGEHHVDDVANTLKRFFRDLGDGLFTRRWSQDWLRATGEAEGRGEGASRCRKAEPGPPLACSSRCASGVQMFPLASAGRESEPPGAEPGVGRGMRPLAPRPGLARGGLALRSCIRPPSTIAGGTRVPNSQKIWDAPAPAAR